MTIIDVGTGPAVVLVPGIQGRWEWMRPAVDALAQQCRVVTFSLADEPTSGVNAAATDGFDLYVRQVGEAMDKAGLDRAVVGGVSFGGLVATAFAARHPSRVSGLVLVSALPPTWRPDPRIRAYIRRPWLHLPLFSLGSLRMYPEIARAFGGGPAAWGGALRHLATVLRHPFSPARMARRVRRWEAHPLDAATLRIQAPTLVVTGQPGLDRVVPVELTRQYVKYCDRAETAVLERTGHIGLVTRPDAFARVVAAFAARCADAEDGRNGSRAVEGRRDGGGYRA